MLGDFLRGCIKSNGRLALAQLVLLCKKVYRALLA